ARHDREPRPRQPGAQLPAEPVVGVVLGEAGRAEDGHARAAGEVERAEAAQELEEDLDRAAELEAPRLGAVEEPDLLRRPGRLAPLGWPRIPAASHAPMMPRSMPGGNVAAAARRGPGARIPCAPPGGS